MSDITLLIARLRNGAWEKRWPEELLITAARTMQDLLDENNRLRYSTIELERRLRVQESEKAELKALREALRECADSFEEYSAYAGEYLVKKHGVEEELARYHALLEEKYDG